MENIGTYVITHLNSGVFYVGSSEDIIQRERGHRHLLNVNKHGSDKLQTVYNEDNYICFDYKLTNTRDEAYDLEQGIINRNKGNLLMANIAIDVRFATKGLPVSDKVKIMHSISSTGRKHTQETKDKIALSKIGKCSDSRKEHLQKLANAQRGVPLSEEHKRKVGEASKGRVLSEEHKAKISLSSKGKIKSPEHIAKIQEARKDFKHTDETKQKISQSGIIRHQKAKQLTN